MLAAGCAAAAATAPLPAPAAARSWPTALRRALHVIHRRLLVGKTLRGSCWAWARACGAVQRRPARAIFELKRPSNVGVQTATHSQSRFAGQESTCTACYRRYRRCALCPGTRNQGMPTPTPLRSYLIRELNVNAGH